MEIKYTVLVLAHMGIQSPKQGYHYLVEIIHLAVNSDTPFYKLKDLYQMTADSFRTTPLCVETNVKSFLKEFWHDSEKIKQFETFTGYEMDEALTPKEFIFLVADFIRCHDFPSYFGF